MVGPYQAGLTMISINNVQDLIEYSRAQDDESYLPVRTQNPNS